MPGKAALLASFVALLGFGLCGCECMVVTTHQSKMQKLFQQNSYFILPSNQEFLNCMASFSPSPSLFKQKNSLGPVSRAEAKIPASVVLLQMCQNFQEVRQLHAQFVVSGLLDRPLNAGRLIESYVSLSEICYALSVFDEMSYPDVFAYNTIIRGLTLGKCPYDALFLYNQLLLVGLVPDNYTYTFVLKACSHLRAVSEGKQVHGQILKAGITPDTHIHSSLMRMYATSSDSIDCAERVLAGFADENLVANNSMITGYMSQGHVEKASAIFSKMAAKDAASWSAMVTGYTKNGLYAEALIVFKEMMVVASSQVLPNESTIVSSLSACAHLGALDQGRWIHAYIDKIGSRISVTLGTALVDMYAKCGSIECGYGVFRNMPRKDVVAWGVIISGFALHGQAEKCFQLFDEMIADGTPPNAVIFVAVLSACSHAGYVKLGRHYFNQMIHDFGIRPSIEHYGCMVDLLGRAGRLAEAEEVILTMPEEPNSIIWGAFLGACRIHNDLSRGRRAFRYLIELDPMSGDRYKLAGNMFASAGEKEDAAEIRKFIRENDLETTCGSSFIQVDGTIQEFSILGNIHHTSQSQQEG